MALSTRMLRNTTKRSGRPDCSSNQTVKVQTPVNTGVFFLPESGSGLRTGIWYVLEKRRQVGYGACWGVECCPTCRPVLGIEALAMNQLCLCYLRYAILYPVAIGTIPVLAI